MDDVIALFRQYKDPVYRLALSFTGSPADAEDVTQTVFLKYLETGAGGGQGAGLAPSGDGQSVPGPVAAAAPPGHRPPGGGPGRGRPPAQGGDGVGDRENPQAHGPGRPVPLLLRGVLHRGDRPDAPGEPELRHLPAVPGQKKAEGTAGTGGIP